MITCSVTGPVRADYGIDTPGVVRNLALMGLIGVVVALAAGILQGVLAVAVRYTGVAFALFGFAEAGLMVWSSKVGKYRPDRAGRQPCSTLRRPRNMSIPSGRWGGRRWSGRD